MFSLSHPRTYGGSGLATMILLAVQLAMGTLVTAAATEQPAPYLKVMSFNIRYGAANDGENSWPYRKQFVMETIQSFQPDLLGLQEVVDFQAAYLRSNLVDYAFHGVGREDGKARGEFVPVMFRRDRFALLESGHFWLSETPDIAGSKSWDSSLPRMVSWVMLQDLRAETPPFVFANAHFDHRGEEARLESARLIREKALELGVPYPIILTGDFNTTEDLDPYQVLTGSDSDTGGEWVDTYRAIHPNRTEWEATFNGWRGQREGSRIDWILHTPQFHTLDATIHYMSEAERTPSDHYPVSAIVRQVKPSNEGDENQ